LDQFVVVTYYLFYPLTEYPPDSTARRAESAVRREGQWEAVSLYYRTRRDPTFRFPRPDGLPFVTFDDIEPSQMELQFLSFSKTVRSDDPNPGAEARSSSGAYWVPTSPPVQFSMMSTPQKYLPAVFVTSGTHKNLFSPAATATVTEGGPNPKLAAAGAVSGTIGGGLMAGCAIPVLCILGIFFLVIAVILTALSVVFKEGEKTSYSPTGPENDFVPPGGAVFGYPSGLAIKVEPISRLAPAQGEEGNPINTSPPWWDYPGRWGIRVARSASARWDNGTRRTDHRGRSRAYWNTLALLRFLVTHPTEAEKAMGS
jgi:hypothetical protein